jgi:hypothetical protein
MLPAVRDARGEIGRAIRIHQNLLLRPDLPAALRHEAQVGLALDFRRGAREASSRGPISLAVRGRAGSSVSDIVAAHIEIFSPTNTSICARQLVPGP